MEMEENSRLYIGLSTPIISCLIHAHPYPLHLYSTLFLAQLSLTLISPLLSKICLINSLPRVSRCVINIQFVTTPDLSHMQP